MIIALLVLIFFAILFPGVVRAVILVLCIGVGYAVFAGGSGRATSAQETLDPVAATRAGPATYALSVLSDPVELPDDFPKYNPDRFCDYRVSFVASADKQTFRHACIDSEQQGYERLKDQWLEVSTEEKKRALAVIAESPSAYAGGSYSALSAFLGGIIERDRLLRQNREMQSPNHFNYD
ncbi:MAG: hypothetical protein P4M05_28435 [Bradyrhizobium sp.]|nr:hypothetical protein [Bradyrhizobium sp.]